MSKANKRSHGRSLARPIQSSNSPIAGGTRQVGAISIGPDNSIKIDASRLEAPSRAYDADYAWIEYRPGNVSLLFAKKSRDESDKLHSRLEVRYPPEDLVNTFWGISARFVESLRGYVGRWPEEARRTEQTSKLPAKQSHSEWASFTYMSHSGTDAAIDFYHMAASGIAKFTQTGSTAGLKFNPVVRIEMTAFELLAFLDRMAPIVEDIRQTLPEQHRGATDEELDA